MRNGFLGSIAALAAGAGLAWGQPPSLPYGHGAPTTIVAPPIAGGALPSDPMPYPSYPTYPSAGPPPGYVDPGVYPGGGVDPYCGPGGAPSGPPEPMWWFNGEYLMWFLESQPVPFPLLTTSSPVDLGILGQPTTGILFGGGDIGYNVTSGFRLNLGSWLTGTQRLGWEVVGMSTENDSVDFDAVSGSQGVPLFARPFVNSATGIPTAQLVAFPQFAAGFVRIKAESQAWGTEANMMVNLFRSTPGSSSRSWTVNWLCGFRYFQIQESVRINTTSQLLPGTTAPFAGLFLAAPAEIGVTDYFETRNGFYAGQVGLQTTIEKGRWMCSLGGKVALGDNNQRLDVLGQSTARFGPSDPITGDPPELVGVQGGLLANVGNIGRYRSDQFAVLPEMTCRLGYQLTPNATIFCGCNLLYMSDVARAGAQINPVINPALVPTSGAFGQGGFIGNNPITMREEDVWIKGLNFGFRLRY